MQRKALKQLGKVTQWTSEKVFSGEKTQLSDDFTEFERDIDVRRIGVERLHATSLPFFRQITKVKPSEDPYPPAGSGKDKILHTEALGLVMIDHGGDIGDIYGDGLTKYGRARCKLAVAQEEFGARLSDNYIAGMEAALDAVNDYKVFRKKLDSRRLALDSAISRAQGSKKDSRALEEDVNLAQMRFEEVEEDTQSRMQGIQMQEGRQWAELSDLLGAELEYFSKCKDILEELRDSWPTGSVSTRPRAKSTASARSVTRAAPSRSYRDGAGSDESDHIPNRLRSQNASSTGKAKEKRSMLPSFGSFGKKGALTSLGSGRKSFVKDRYGNLDEDDTREGLPSDDEEVSVVGRHRSHSNLSASRVILEGEDYQAAPPMRRIHTTPPTRTKLVRAIYNFDGGASDELTFRADDVIEVKKEVSDDWWIGEIHGRSGLFPSSFCEIVASPITATPSLPKRSVPPPREMPTSPMLDLTSDSEHSHGFSDADDRVKIPLYASAQPTATRPTKKPAPPPPPSKRSASSNNIITAHTVNSSPPPSFARARSNTASRQPILDSPLEGSPFGGSDDEDENDGVPTPVAGGLSHGLATVHLANNGTSHGKCSACSCDDFTQNVFKAKGMCSSCYHQH